MNSHFPEPPRGAGRLRRGIAAVALVSLVAVGAATWSANGSAADDLVARIAPAGASERVIGNGTDSYASIVAKVAPAVVTIRSEQRVRQAQRRLPFMDPLGEQPPPRRGGLGSGVIVDSGGYILTNYHVIDGADRVRVELKDRRALDATIVGSDAASDLAVLKVEATNLPVVALGDSEAVDVGDVVLALGNPLGIGQTVTMGIISAKGRATGLGDGSFEDFLQTDAPINSGNSGGALVNTRGELVGINSQILSPSGGNIGIAFSIPVNMARSVMTALVNDGEVRRGRLGIAVQGVTSDVAEGLQLREISGAVVTSVDGDSPAERAGLQPGDVITAINGTRVLDSNELRNRIAHLGPNARVTLTVVRDGKAQQLAALLEELRANPTAPRRGR